MENPAANHLPEVDTLPDGFVESSDDPIALETLTLDQDQTIVKYRYESYDNVTNLDRSSEIDNVDNLDASMDGKEQAQSMGALTNGFDDSTGIVLEPVSKQTECLSDVPNTPSKEKLQVEDHSQSFQRFDEGDLNTQAKKEILVSESSETIKGKKIETSDVKRKNVKRTFKSEKEYLELTLKYHQVLSERDGAIAVRDKLESLCRELQRQNKMLMDECKKVSTEGQNLRLDLSNKFQDAIKDVSNKLEEHKNDSLSQLKENEMLRNKLNQFADQYTLAEQQFAQKLKQKSLELQIADLKLKQHEEKSIQEQSQMKLYVEQVSQLLATEKTLRSQLSADGEKFQQFQEALVKSNEVFETFKKEIEKMTKSIKELKKENTFLKGKSEKSDVTLIELVEERERLKKQLEKTKNQKEKLESLCRSLQAERKQNDVKSNTSDSVDV